MSLISLWCFHLGLLHSFTITYINLVTHFSHEVLFHLAVLILSNMVQVYISFFRSPQWVFWVLKYKKSVWRIWQHFSCLLDEGILKIWKKLNSHGGFLRADQGRAKMCCHMGWIGCAFLQVATFLVLHLQSQHFAHFLYPVFLSYGLLSIILGK